MIGGKYEWLFFVALAGLAWGTYVPLIFYGGNELPQLDSGRAGVGSRLMAILCVGIAYFVIGVVFPLAMFFSGQASWPEMRGTGLSFSAAAGVAGAVGALCVVFASSAAIAAARDSKLPLDTFRIYIAPLIFGLAPIINTLVSSLWHPQPGDPFHFRIELPGWKLWLGIFLVGAGAALVLFSKEEAEVERKLSEAKHKPAVVAMAPPAANPPTSGEKA
jgi:drug/metabolite transporter (DMT)-like permease